MKARITISQDDIREIIARTLGVEPEDIEIKATPKGPNEDPEVSAELDMPMTLQNAPQGAIENGNDAE